MFAALLKKKKKRLVWLALKKWREFFFLYRERSFLKMGCSSLMVFLPRASSTLSFLELHGSSRVTFEVTTLLLLPVTHFPNGWDGYIRNLRRLYNEGSVYFLEAEVIKCNEGRKIFQHFSFRWKQTVVF